MSMHPLDLLLVKAKMIDHELQQIAKESTSIGIRNTRAQNELQELHLMIVAMKADIAEAQREDALADMAFAGLGNRPPAVPAVQSKTWPEQSFAGTVCRDQNCPCRTGPLLNNNRPYSDM